MNDMKYITEKDIPLLFDFARKEANQALMENEVPIGSVIFNKDINEIIGSSHNRVQLNNNPFDHAEILALREAMINFNSYFRALFNVLWCIIKCRNKRSVLFG